MVLLSMLRSKMLTKISIKNQLNAKKLVKILINYQYIDIFALYRFEVHYVGIEPLKKQDMM